LFYFSFISDVTTV